MAVPECDSAMRDRVRRDVKDDGHVLGDAAAEGQLQLASLDALRELPGCLSAKRPPPAPPG
ncbi:hypothetical protein SAMN06264364_14421 [Quadrisphaera granulorum]|uniref:Uncharacterized protein n=2 Tax=Quadrisphaera granulorum TaxID=317664 RepID=A0A316AAS5_9ACTN|nr:hypothetical protein BXY45_14421 [Quadrisphaera granulorum]SZE99009.1 hypothetical protein SAMN06264364_14421 [Quadrisphaera granulorum]